MASPIGLQFGVEVELLAGSRTKQHMDWHATAGELSQNLQRASIPNHVNKDHNKEVETFKEWSIIQEVTITNQMMQNRWGLELVSPIFNFAQRDIWAAHVRSIWLTLQGNFETFPSRQTSTHVHVSPTVAPWATDHVRKIAKAAVYFERCVDSLLPPERYANLWCQSNRYNHLLKGQNMGDIFSWLDQAQTSDHIAYYMCAFSKDSPYGKAMGKQTDFSHNVFRWNFTPLKDRKGTIEFRQPPGSNRGEDTALWISFTIAFVQGAVQHCDKLNPQEAPTLDLLKRLLIGGATASGMKETTLLQNLFAGKKQLAPGAFDLKDASATDLKVMAHKAQEANITLEKFKKLYGYK